MLNLPDRLPAAVPRLDGPRRRRRRDGLVMLSRWLGGLAAAAVALVACVLVILDLTDTGLRRWWDAHALTTDTIAGLLVLMITVLVVDQVVRLRQGNSRARAVATQVAILTTQANIASRAVSQVLAGTGDRPRPAALRGSGPALVAPGSCWAGSSGPAEPGTGSCAGQPARLPRHRPLRGRAIPPLV